MDLRNVIDKNFDNVVRILPLPDLAEEGIIAVKNLLKNEEVQEKIKEIFNNTINKDGHVVKNINEIKETVKQEGIKEGISKTIDIIINNAKKSKEIDKNIANILKESKELIIDSAINEELQNRYKGQENVLKQIDMQYIKWEEKLKNMDLEGMNRIYKEIQKEFTKLIPTIEIINKINAMDNLTILVSNKLKNGENTINEIEKEICRKAG